MMPFNNEAAPESPLGKGSPWQWNADDADFADLRGLGSLLLWARMRICADWGLSGVSSTIQCALLRCSRFSRPFRCGTGCVFRVALPPRLFEPGKLRGQGACGGKCTTCPVHAVSGKPIAVEYKILPKRIRLQFLQKLRCLLLPWIFK